MEGVVLAPSAFSITLGAAPSMTATQLLVVPRSMPITFAMADKSFLSADGFLASYEHPPDRPLRWENRRKRPENQPYPHCGYIGRGGRSRKLPECPGFSFCDLVQEPQSVLDGCRG